MGTDSGHVIAERSPWTVAGPCAIYDFVRRCRCRLDQMMLLPRCSTVSVPGAGHCSASIFNGIGLHALLLRLCRKVTMSDPFQFALRHCSVQLVGRQRRHPSLRSSLATVPCCLERRCSFAAMAYRYARRCARLRSRETRERLPSSVVNILLTLAWLLVFRWHFDLRLS